MEISNDQASAPRRYVEVVAFVAVWMALGWAASLDPNAYLLLGVPLVLLFQCLVARRPLAALWVRAAERIVLGPRDLVLAALAMVAPALTLATTAIPAREVTVSLWLACAVLGAFGVAFAFRTQDREGIRHAMGFAAGALAWGCGLFALRAVALHRAALPDVAMLVPLARQFLLYLPVLFLLEEVAFRGALDAHLIRPGALNRHPGLASVLVAALWGLWHLPIIPGAQSALGVVSLLLVHVPMGVLLAYTWRKSGTLLLPAMVHAAVDAYRNALGG